MPDLLLYTNPMSRGRIARIMLEEIGEEYEVSHVDFDAPRADAHLAANPMGKVPTLVHGQTAVSEAAAIGAYLADAFADAGMAPPPGQRGAYYKWLFFGAGPVEQAVTLKGLDMLPGEDKAQTVGFGTHARVMDTLEAGMPQGDAWIAGETFTMADVYIGAQIGWGLQFGTMEARPGFQRYVERCNSRPACVRATKLDDALMPAHD